MKGTLCILLAATVMCCLAACGSTQPAPAAQPQQTQTPAPTQTEQTPPPAEPSPQTAPETSAPPAEPAPETPAPLPETSGKEVLVVVFSVTGTTKGVADKIAALEDADLYEIRAAQEYTSADLSWHDSKSRTTLEQNDKALRPEIGSDPISLEGYTTVYIGYPIWWGEEPRIMDTFVESYDFDGITVIPFCTSGSSGIGRSGKNLAENAGSGTWLDGKRFGAGVSETELQSWIDSLK